jgi:hypothetical protein
MSADERFKQAEESWDLDRLYSDLTKIKGNLLTRTEKLHLRGLLCGYSPTTLAKKLHKSPRGIQADISNTVNRYVKELVGRSQKKEVKKLNSSGEIGNLLEEIGYKKTQDALAKGITLPIESMDSVVKINNSNLITNNQSVTVEINIRLITSLPIEQLTQMLADKDDSNQD